MDPVDRFAELVAAGEPSLDLAMLAIASGADPRLDETRWLTELDRLADGVTGVDGLLRRLYTEAGFTGNRDNYYDPRNSLLPWVLRRRLGIPITLATVCIEVGRRAGVALEGIGMPGHFLLRVPGTERYLDPFDRGAELDVAGCEALFRSATGAGGRIPFGPHLLAAVPARTILIRVLQNLRLVYRARRRPADLEWVLRMRVVLPDVEATDLIELGDAIGRQGRWLDGARLLDAEAADRPDDADELRRAAGALRARLN